MAAVLVLVIGLPGAGKTTLVERLLRGQNETFGMEYASISFDDIMRKSRDNDYVQHDEFDPVQWKECQQQMVMHVHSRLSARRQSDMQLVLLVDDNFQYRSLRKRYFHVAVQARCGFGILYVSTPIEICRQRNASRESNERIPEAVFQRMAEAFEPPNSHESPFEQNTQLLYAADENEQSANKKIQALFVQAKLKLLDRSIQEEHNHQKRIQRANDQLKTSRSLIHGVDLQLRQWVALVLRTEHEFSDRNIKAAAAQRLNKLRTDYLRELKEATSNDMSSVEGRDGTMTVEQLVDRFHRQRIDESESK